MFCGATYVTTRERESLGQIPSVRGRRRVGLGRREVGPEVAPGPPVFWWTTALPLPVCWAQVSAWGVQVILFHVGQELGHPAPVRVAADSNSTPDGRPTIVVVVIVAGQGDLFQVVHTLSAGRGFADLLHGRQEQANEDGNNRDHDQELNEGKPWSA